MIIIIFSQRYSAEPSISRYAKIALELQNNKTIRDIAMRCRWMHVKVFLYLLQVILFCFSVSYSFPSGSCLCRRRKKITREEKKTTRCREEPGLTIRFFNIRFNSVRFLSAGIFVVI